MIVRLEDPDDPGVAPYRAGRARDRVGRHGRSVAEGGVVLDTAARTDAGLESVLVAEHRLEGLADILSGLPKATPVYAAAQAVMDRIVGFPMHRGILAIGRRPRRGAGELLDALPPAALVVGLVGIANHDNMGGVFRNAAAFGADAIMLDDTCCDPLYRKAIRVSVGAALTVPFARAGSGEALTEALKRRGFVVLALSPRGAVELRSLTRPPRAAVLFGPEGAGLPEAVMAQARGVRIPMSGGFDSLNVATTSGIVLHHLINPPD